MSELLTLAEVQTISSKCGPGQVVNWATVRASDKVLGYLGEHLKLTITTIHSDTRGGDGGGSYTAFVKCVPRRDHFKAQHLRELQLFRKEYVMLSRLFNEFGGDCGENKWRPEVLLAKEELFVFEDVTELGYKLAQGTMALTDVNAVVEAIATFHVQTFILENRKSKVLKRPYSLWEDYSQYLTDPPKCQRWRDAGRDAVVAYLKVYSKYKFEDHFVTKIEEIIPQLFTNAQKLMEPSTRYRNAIVHRDLWTNNIFLKHGSGSDTKALIIDFQTVIYCSPLLDLSSFLYFNTDLEFRKLYTDSVVALYHKTLTKKLSLSGVNLDQSFDKDTIVAAYEDSILFGLTQAAIIVPITAMDDATRTRLFTDPEISMRVNEESRSAEIIEAAHDETYRRRISELFDELVERYII